MSRGPVLIDFCPCEWHVYTQESGLAGWHWRRDRNSALSTKPGPFVDRCWQELFEDGTARRPGLYQLLDEIWIAQLRHRFQFNWIQINVGAPRYLAQKSCSYNMAGTFCYRKISNAIIEQWHFIWWPVVTLRLVMLSSSWSTLWVLDHTVSHPLTLAKLAKENWNRLLYDTRIQFCTLFWHSLITDHTATRFNIHYAGWRKLKQGAWSHSFTSINIS